MRHFFINLLLLLFAFTMQAQPAVTVTGTVTQVSDGSPVANWTVYAVSGDSILYSEGVGTTNQSGVYSITLTGSPIAPSEVFVYTFKGCNDPSGDFDSKVVPVVNGACSANFQVCNLPPPNCTAIAKYYPISDLTVQFSSYYSSADNASAAYFTWDFGDGFISNEENPVHTYAQEGVYTATLTITGSDGCKATVVTDVYLQNFQFCWAYINFAPGNDSLAFNFSAQYYGYDSLNTAVSYLWNFGDGTSSTEANPSHTYTAEGFYIVTVDVIGSDSCEAHAEFPFSTDFQPGPECFTYILYDHLDTTTFHFSSINKSLIIDSTLVLSYLWQFGDSTTSTESNPIHAYAAQGIYNVLLTVTTADGCVAEACAVVFAYDTPVDTFWYGCQAMYGIGYPGIDSLGNPSGGNSLQVQFYDLSFGTPVSWVWNFGDGDTSHLQNPVHIYNTEGTYKVTLSIVTVDGCESSAVYEIYVGDNAPWDPEWDCQALFFPIPDSLGSNGFQFFDMSYSPSPIQTWKWSFGDGTSSTEQNPFHLYSLPGVYTVSLSIIADSCNSVISFDIDTKSPWNFNNQSAVLGKSGSVTSTQTPQVFDAVKAFPNPATNDLHLVFNAQTGGDYELRITDISGKVLTVNQLNSVSGANATKVDVSKLVPGLYLAELRAADRVQTIKFVKQ
ncbi:MAG: PKD domain-containing protein [Bacteroidota bacterium]